MSLSQPRLRSTGGEGPPTRPTTGSVDGRLDEGRVYFAQVAAAGTAPVTKVPPVEESLRRLKALHDEGILTDEEYETKPRALADQL